MSFGEKFFSLLAITYVSGLAAFLVFFPSVRELRYLLPLSLVGVAVNVGLLFIVFKDIFTRSFPSPTIKYCWIILIFIFLPAVIIYLPKYGFKKR